MYVSGPIHIGRGTTVKILGEAAVDHGSTSTEGSDYGTESLPTTLPLLPNGLTSAVVSTSFEQQQQSTSDKDTDRVGGVAPAGSLFFVDGGQLFLENLAVRGGDAGNFTSSSSSNTGGGYDGGYDGFRGGGVHAVDANVTVTGCEFEDNFAHFMGGGIFTNRSSLVVVGSVFRRCHADVASSPGDDVHGAGGGIGVRCGHNSSTCPFVAPPRIL